MLLEICVDTIEDALLAEQAGADRIELCANLDIGGTTPSFNFIKEAKEKLTIPFFPIIRPRGGNFVYSNAEFEEMKKAISFCKEINCSGVVFGILNNADTINIEQTKELVALAKPMQVTFHRAFDRIENKKNALEQLIELGFDRVLTSGHINSVNEGLEVLQVLVQKANNRIIILPGGGVRSENSNLLKSRLCVTELHSSARLGGKLQVNEVKKLKG